MASKGWGKKPKKVKRKPARAPKKKRLAHFTVTGVQNAAYRGKVSERANAFKLSELKIIAKDYLTDHGWRIGKKFIYSPELWQSLRQFPIKFRRVLKPKSIRHHLRLSPRKATVHLVKALRADEKQWLLDNGWVEGRRLIWHPGVMIKVGMWRGRKSRKWSGISLVDQEAILREVNPELAFVDKLNICPWSKKEVKERGLISFEVARRFIEHKKVDCFPAAFVDEGVKQFLLSNWVRENLGGGDYYFHPKYRKKIKELTMPANVLVYPLKRVPGTGSPVGYLSSTAVERLADRYGCFDVEGLQDNVVDLMKKKGWQANQFWLWNPRAVREEVVAEKKRALAVEAKAGAKSAKELFLKNSLEKLKSIVKNVKAMTAMEFQTTVKDTVFEVLETLDENFKWKILKRDFNPKKIPLSDLTAEQVKFLEDNLAYFKKGKYLTKRWY